MTRRRLLQTLTGLVPAAHAHIEPEVQSRDLVVLEVPGPISAETAVRLRAACDDAGLPRVIVLTDGMRLRVERDILERPTP